MALDFEALTPSWLTPEAQGFIDAYGKTLEEAGALTPADWPSFLSMALSWGTMMASSALTTLLAMSPFEVNRQAAEG